MVVGVFRWEGVGVVIVCVNMIVCIWGDDARIIRTCSANGGVVLPTLGMGGCLFVCLFFCFVSRVKSFGKESK